MTKEPKVISINRAAVLTLWAAVVARRLGFRKAEALTLGKAVAGVNAQAKGRRLGIYSPKDEKPKEARRVTVKRGEQLRLRFGVLVYEGESPGIGDAYRAYVGD